MMPTEAAPYMKNIFSYDEFLKTLENDGIYPIDETYFRFDDDPEDKDHTLGCLREYDRPYRVGCYCPGPAKEIKP